MAAGPAGLGMSYEVADVKIGGHAGAGLDAERVTFTGAAILRRDKAAYREHGLS